MIWYCFHSVETSFLQSEKTRLSKTSYMNTIVSKPHREQCSFQQISNRSSSGNSAKLWEIFFFFFSLFRDDLTGILSNKCWMYKCWPRGSWPLSAIQFSFTRPSLFLSPSLFFCPLYILIVPVETYYYHRTEDHRRLHITWMVNPISRARVHAFYRTERERESTLVPALIMSDATEHSVKCIDMRSWCFAVISRRVYAVNSEGKTTVPVISCCLMLFNTWKKCFYVLKKWIRNLKEIWVWLLMSLVNELNLASRYFMKNMRRRKSAHNARNMQI